MKITNSFCIIQKLFAHNEHIVFHFITRIGKNQKNQTQKDPFLFWNEILSPVLLFVDS